MSTLLLSTEQASSLAALAVKFAVHDPAVTKALVSMHIASYAVANNSALDEPALPDANYDDLATRHRFIKNLNHAGRPTGSPQPAARACGWC